MTTKRYAVESFYMKRTTNHWYMQKFNINIKMQKHIGELNMKKNMPVYRRKLNYKTLVDSKKLDIKIAAKHR